MDAIVNTPTPAQTEIEHIMAGYTDFLSGKPLQPGVYDLGTTLAAISKLIDRRETEARIEAYKHISLSDVGLEEPLRSWLKGYIDKLKKGI